MRNVLLMVMMVGAEPGIILPHNGPCVGADPPLWQSVPHEEYQVYSTGLRRPDTMTAAMTQTQTPMPSTTIPAQFDWRTVLGDIPVRNQEGCGSCWAFAPTVYFHEMCRVCYVGTGGIPAEEHHWNIGRSVRAIPRVVQRMGVLLCLGWLVGVRHIDQSGSRIGDLFSVPRGRRALHQRLSSVG